MNFCKEIIDHEHVKLLLKYGGTFEGRPVCLEYADETESGEDEIDIETENGKFIGIKESEIEKVYYGEG